MERERERESGGGWMGECMGANRVYGEQRQWKDIRAKYVEE